MIKLVLSYFLLNGFLFLFSMIGVDLYIGDSLRPNSIRHELLCDHKYSENNSKLFQDSAKLVFTSQGPQSSIAFDESFYIYVEHRFHHSTFIRSDAYLRPLTYHSLNSRAPPLA